MTELLTTTDSIRHPSQYKARLGAGFSFVCLEEDARRFLLTWSSAAPYSSAVKERAGMNLATKATVYWDWS